MWYQEIITPSSAVQSHSTFYFSLLIIVDIIHHVRHNSNLKHQVVNPIREALLLLIFHLIGNWKTVQLNNSPQVINSRKILCTATLFPFIMPLRIPAVATFHLGLVAAVLLSFLQRIMALNHNIPRSFTLKLFQMFFKNSVECHEGTRGWIYKIAVLLLSFPSLQLYLTNSTNE